MGKRANNEGSIYRRQSDGKWVASITLEGGKRKIFYGKTKREVMEKLVAARREQQQGLLTVQGKTKLSEYIRHWLESYRREVRPNTHQRAEEVMRLHILPHLGETPLEKLTSQQLDALYKRKLQELSPTTVQTMHNILHKALSDAIKQAILFVNVTERVTPPRKNEYEARVLNEEEMQTFLKTIRSHPLYALFLIDLTTGMRRGEIVGLKWSDIDLNKGRVQIRRAIVRRPRILGGGYAEAPLKTKQSRRSILLPASVLLVLLEYRAQQQEHVQQDEQLWNEHGWVFCKADGAHLNPQHDVYEVFKEVLKAAGLPDIRFHDLRHTAATMHLGMMTNPKIVQELLGHSSISITMDAYSHVLPSMHQEAMEHINRWFLSLPAASSPAEPTSSDGKPEQYYTDDDDQEGNAASIPA